MKEILLYGTVGEEISPTLIRQELSGAGDVHLRIHSYGGSVHDGNAILTALREHEGRITATIDGVAASMAAVIALQADHLSMPENAWIMFHEAGISSWDRQEADDLRRSAGILDAMNADIVQRLADRTGWSTEETAAALKEEVWMNGVEAGQSGIAHEITAASQMAACAKVPDHESRVPRGTEKLDETLSDKVSNLTMSFLTALGLKKDESEITLKGEDLKQAEAQFAEATAEIERMKSEHAALLAKKAEEIEALEKSQTEATAKIAELEAAAKDAEAKHAEELKAERESVSAKVATQLTALGVEPIDPAALKDIEDKKAEAEAKYASMKPGKERIAFARENAKILNLPTR